LLSFGSFHYLITLKVKFGLIANESIEPLADKNTSSYQQGHQEWDKEFFNTHVLHY